jgi:hypothetical protein
VYFLVPIGLNRSRLAAPDGCSRKQRLGLQNSGVRTENPEEIRIGKNPKSLAIYALFSNIEGKLMPVDTSKLQEWR